MLYTLGRVSLLNFPLSDEQRYELDALGLAGVLAELDLARQGRRMASCRAACIQKPASRSQAAAKAGEYGRTEGNARAEEGGKLALCCVKLQKSGRWAGQASF